MLFARLSRSVCVTVLVPSKIGATNLSYVIVVQCCDDFCQDSSVKKLSMQVLTSYSTLKETCLLFFEKFYCCGMMVE